MEEGIAKALSGQETVVDITTIGRKSGTQRRLEIWCHNIDGRYIITGQPGPRNWLANLKANPEFTLHVKGEVEADLPATARIITDPAERQAIATARYSNRGDAPSAAGRPMVEVLFRD